MPKAKKKKEFCAICNNTNKTTKLCQKCTKSPYNRDWVAQPWWEVSFGDVEDVLPQKQSVIPRGDYTKKQKSVLDLDIQSGNVLTMDELAKKAGCSPQYAEKVIKKFLGAGRLRRYKP